MSWYYETVDEATQKLSGTLILYKGIPHEVKAIKKPNNKFSLEIYNLIEKKLTVVGAEDPDLNFYNIRLGYFFVPRIKAAVYCSRKPARQWKQGLGFNRMSFKGSGKVFDAQGPLLLDRFTDLYENKYFSDLFLNIYPTFAQAVKVLKEDRTIHSVPFNRVFAVGLDHLDRYEVYYKGESVAWSSSEDRVILPSSYSYLKETLEENGIEYVL